MDQPSSHLKIKRNSDVCIAEFADRKILEELSIQEIGEELDRVVESEPSIRLLLDFRNVDHLSSAALGMLLSLNRKIKEKNGMLKLSGIDRKIMEVFKITRLDRVFSISETSGEALTQFSQA